MLEQTEAHKRAVALRDKLLKEVKVAAQVGDEGELEVRPTGYVSTRVPMIDFLIGRPGIPLGGLSVLAGAYGSGKTSLCYHIVAETQAMGGQAVFFDTEGRFDFDRAKKLGVNPDAFLLVQPETLEETYEGARQVIEAAREVVGPDDLVTIIIDSSAGAPLKDDLEGEGTNPGAYSRYLSSEMKVFPGLVRRQRIGLILTSQPRQKLEFGRWGRPEVTWMGERALGHAASTILLLEEQQKIGDDPNSPEGYRILVTNKDTRIAGVGRKGWRRTVDFYSATGFDYYGSLVDLLIDPEVKLLSYKSGWYTWRDNKPFRRKDITEKLEEWPELVEAIAQVLEGNPSDGNEASL